MTGAAGGIGSAIARRLASDRFRVALADRDETGLAGLAG
ncbi:MAG TPA: SDR family NAD(P)-dependent oxidoreductase, partial [Chloroflexota bacterium]